MVAVPLSPPFVLCALLLGTMGRSGRHTREEERMLVSPTTLSIRGHESKMIISDSLFQRERKRSLMSRSYDQELTPYHRTSGRREKKTRNEGWYWIEREEKKEKRKRMWKGHSVHTSSQDHGGGGS
ncbi:MAG: hypothetical protein DHS80DRAFT_23087 [Piptocephalis tieghemiana]|nr:MAG: hypothetical protein DHS80DRAFT_23087 [Piptocephalis tieghemiana]